METDARYLPVFGLFLYMLNCIADNPYFQSYISDHAASMLEIHTERIGKFQGA
jgi:hypothetical protein